MNFPGAMEQLKKIKIGKAVFVTENNRELLSKSTGLKIMTSILYWEMPWNPTAASPGLRFIQWKRKMCTGEFIW